MTTTSDLALLPDANAYSRYLTLMTLAIAPTPINDDMREIDAMLEMIDSHPADTVLTPDFMRAHHAHSTMMIAHYATAPLPCRCDLCAYSPTCSIC